MDKYRLMEDDTFLESYFVDVQYAPWPHTMVFFVWSTRRQSCFRITARTVLELHYETIYTEPLDNVDGMLVSIDALRNDDFRYWSDRIRLLAAHNGGDEAAPICLVFDSHIFAGRRHDTRLTTRDVGMLVVCRDFEIERDASYDGPRPFPHNIPSSDE